MLDEGTRNIFANAMDMATCQHSWIVFFLMVGVILFKIVSGIITNPLSALHELKNERIGIMKNKYAMPLFGAPPFITQRSAPSRVAGSTTTSTRSVSSPKQDLFDHGLTLGFKVWLAVPGAAFEEHGMTWDETATHAALSLPMTPAMRKSLKCAFKQSPEDPTTSRVIMLQWAGGQLVLPLSDLIRCKEMDPARVTGGFLRLPMKKVTPGKWGSLVAVTDAAALNSAAAAASTKPAKPAAETDEASAEQQLAAVEDVVAEIEHMTPAPAPAGETGEAEPPAGSESPSPDGVAHFDFDESLGCFSGDRHAPYQIKVPDLARSNLGVHAWKDGKEEKEKEHNGGCLRRRAAAHSDRNNQSRK